MRSRTQRGTLGATVALHVTHTSTALALLALAAMAPVLAQPGAFPRTVGVDTISARSLPVDARSVWRTPPDSAALPDESSRPVDPVVATVTVDQALYSIAIQSGLPVVGIGLSQDPTDVEIPAGTALDAVLALAAAEGLIVSLDNGTLVVSDAGQVPSPFESQPPLPPPLQVSFGTSDASPGQVSVDRSPSGDPLVSVSAQNAPLVDVLREIASAADLSFVIASPGEVQVTAYRNRLSLDDALRALLLGTALTYRRDGNALVVADRQLSGMLTTRLLRLRHIPAAGVVDRLPESLQREAAYQLIQEQSVLLVTAPADIVSATEAFVAELDVEPDQILLEVLVIEFETSGMKQIGVSFLGGLAPEDPGTPALAGPGRPAYVFGDGDDQRGGLDIVGDAEAANRSISFWRDVLGIRSIGRLPTDFYFRLQALERAGRAQVRSRPHVATLNGNTAFIPVGTSQYYILRSSFGYGQAGPFGSGGDTARFESVRADVQLEITPYVTRPQIPGEPAEVTAIIRPTFATPVGALDPRVPPTIRSWSVDTSVRLRDGETFMIGGLIQEGGASLRTGSPSSDACRCSGGFSEVHPAKGQRASSSSSSRPTCSSEAGRPSQIGPI